MEGTSKRMQMHSSLQEFKGRVKGADHHAMPYCGQCNNVHKAKDHHLPLINVFTCHFLNDPNIMKWGLGAFSAKQCAFFAGS